MGVTRPPGPAKGKPRKPGKPGKPGKSRPARQTSKRGQALVGVLPSPPVPVETGKPAAKYGAKWHPSACDRVIDLMAEGASKVEAAVALGITRAAFYKWLDEHPDFAAAVAEGSWRSQAWWERQGRLSLRDPTLSPALWFMQMKNRFPQDWRDRHDVTATHTVSLGDLLVSSVEAVIGRSTTES